jgi:DNA repair exonuclease SbcCD ATPase subunit
VIKDEFKTLEKHIRELEALRHYPRVKKERDSLAMEVVQLKEKVAALESEVSTKNGLSSQLSKREAEINELAGKLAGAEKELASLRNFKVKLPDSTELTLDEMRAPFLHAEEDEIERRAKERLTALEKDMESRMPTLVHERLIQLLKCPEWPPEIAEVIDSKARQIGDGILAARDRWPDWFKSYYLDEVNALVSQQLNTEFEKRVQSEAEKRLELMKAGEWKEYASSKARAIASSLKDLLKELQGTWRFSCDRCGCRLSIDLSPSDVGLLLGGETIDITCTACLDPAPFPFILSTVRHKVVSLTLGRLLELYMGSAPP